MEKNRKGKFKGKKFKICLKKKNSLKYVFERKVCLRKRNSQNISKKEKLLKYV